MLELFLWSIPRRAVLRTNQCAEGGRRKLIIWEEIFPKAKQLSSKYLLLLWENLAQRTSIFLKFCFAIILNIVNFLYFKTFNIFKSIKASRKLQLRDLRNNEDMRCHQNDTFALMPGVFIFMFMLVLTPIPPMFILVFIPIPPPTFICIYMLGPL